MKIFISSIILILFFQSFAKADDIRDFQIEGISLKDEISKHLNQSEINNNKVKMFKSDEFTTLQFSGEKFNSAEYDLVEINYKESALIVESIGGVKLFQKIKDCHKKQDEIIDELKGLFLNDSKIKFLGKKNFIHAADPSDQSTFIRASFEFPNGDKVSVDCNNYSEEFLKKYDTKHQLYVAIDSKLFDDFLMSGRAY